MVRIAGWIWLISAVVLNATAQYNVDEEMVRIKKELEKVEAERKAVKSEVAQDKTELAAYRERNARRVAMLKTQIDSLQTQVKAVKTVHDSLDREYSAISVKTRQQELLQKTLRETILKSAHSLMQEAGSVPPIALEQIQGSLGYLISEITAGSIDNTEAFYRLVQIVHDMLSISKEIQVVESTSPIPNIHGTIYRLRIGMVFEAIVDSRGEKAFLWNGTGEWEAVSDPAITASLFKAVRIREGKTVPVLVELPFTSVQNGGRE